MAAEGRASADRWRWLQWARRIQALSQSGLAYSHNQYDRERYEQLLAVAAEIVANHAGLATAAIRDNFRLQPGYATPKVGVRGAVVQQDQIFLIQRAHQRAPSSGDTGSPGGPRTPGSV